MASSGLVALDPNNLPTEGKYYEYDDSPPNYNYRTQNLIHEYRIIEDNLELIYTIVDKSPEELLEQFNSVKESKIADIANKRWKEMESPYRIEQYDAVFYTDKLSISDMVAATDDLRNAIQLGHLASDIELEWKTVTGFIKLKLEDLITVRLLLSQRKQALYNKEALLVNQINEATTEEELDLIKWDD